MDYLNIQIIIERSNSTVKTIKKVTMSMGNRDRFRNRVLYALRKDAHYMLNPIDEPRVRRNYNFKNKNPKK